MDIRNFYLAEGEKPLDRLVSDGGFCGIARGDRCREHHDVLADDHGCDVITEDHLATRSVFGSYHVYGLVCVKIHKVVVSERLSKTCSYNLHTVKTENGIDYGSGLII